MKIELLHIGMKVRHPAYGIGTVVAIGEHTCDIRFDDGAKRTVSPDQSAVQPAEAQAELTGLTIPLKQLVQQLVDQVLDGMGYVDPSSTDPLLGSRWKDGQMILKPRDEGLQPKELPLETFFHKIVMMRNQLRVLEQKINSHGVLTDAEKVDLQQYITRCYGSMTTFNLLFREKEDHF